MFDKLITNPHTLDCILYHIQYLSKPRLYKSHTVGFYSQFEPRLQADTVVLLVHMVVEVHFG